MGIFERLLSLWVALAMGVGVGLGLLFPAAFEVIARLEVARVNPVVAVLIWLMIYPMMLRVDPSCLKHVGRKPKGLALTLVVNWLVKPFTMAALGVLFFKVVFADMVSSEDASQVIAGMILLGVADITVPWGTLVLSVVMFIVVPLVAGMATKRALTRDRLERLVKQLKPASILGLLLTVVLLFGFQAETIVSRPLLVGLIAVPLLIQSYGIFALTYGLARALGLPNVAAPAAMIGTSNFFELAVAVAISLFGLALTAALATVVGVLTEVPVMLSLVAFANRTKRWFPATRAASG